MLRLSTFALCCLARKARRRITNGDGRDSYGDLQRLIASKGTFGLICWNRAPKRRFTRPGVGRFCTQGDGWRPAFRLPVGDHEVLVRFESIQAVQNLVINSVLGRHAQQAVTFGEHQDREWATGVSTGQYVPTEEPHQRRS